MKIFVASLMLLLALSACDELAELEDQSSGTPDGESARVVFVVDGDTIEVELADGTRERVRYVGVNTPERDEPCYLDAKNVNENLVDGRQVTLVRDQTNRDRFGRLLRYIYVGDTFVNETLVSDGYAEAVLYEPDDEHYRNFLALERSAAQSGAGCHDTGIFDDGSDVR